MPLLLVVAALIALDSRGGVLFVQNRLGRDAVPFRMYKFRTMTQGNDDADQRAYVASLIRGDGNTSGGRGLFKLTSDPRLTRVGRVLRMLSIDELPQLFNVLRGDMSLIGPRPPLPVEASLYPSDAWGRLAGRPGMTGLWQVSGRSRLTFQEMIDLDLAYWEEWSPWLDIRILFGTPRAILARETG
jgi:lipopolysaccharide/colanic/teichoic acid biosynthesis glycosyltransferase